MGALMARLLAADDAEQTIAEYTHELIAALASNPAENSVDEPGRERPLRLLLVGYNGARNVGSDIRVAEMIRQFNERFGQDQLRFSLIGQIQGGHDIAFDNLTTIPLLAPFPDVLAREVPKHDVVISCEGSMFTSKFSNAFSIMMAGALGMASAAGKVALAVGAEAGPMDDILSSFVQSHCQDALVLPRSRRSFERLSQLNLNCHSGTDTAWTLPVASPRKAERLLKESGWDGERPLLAICPISPFYWPLQTDPKRALAPPTRQRGGSIHHGSIFFPNDSDENKAKHERYMGALADATNQCLDQHTVHPLVIGMSATDRDVCIELRDRISGRPSCFVNDEYDMLSIAALLMHCRLVVTSRYHAMVVSMIGHVPSIGVSMDDRIANLMQDREHQSYLLNVDQKQLADHLQRRIGQALFEHAAMSKAIQAQVAQELEQLDEMHAVIERYITQHYPHVRVTDA